MLTSEIARNSLLFVLVADSDPERLDYRELLPDTKMQWGFVSREDIFSAALRLQPWDVIIIDQSMFQAIPNELLAAADLQNDDQDLILLLDSEALAQAAKDGLLESCSYLLKGDTLEVALSRMLRRQLYVRSLDRERQHLEQEISRILESWEQSIRDRTQKLEETNQQLKALDEMKTKFLANISHELRTPLTVIRSYVDLLIQCPPQEAVERGEFLDIIANETLRLSRMIDNLLDLARLDAGHVEWDFNDVDLRVLVPNVLGEFDGKLKRGGLRVKNSIPRELPLVHADQERLVQVIRNVLSESIAYTPDGGAIHIRAEMTSDQKGDEVLDMIKVSIEDNGEPFAEEARAQAFDRFAASENDAQTKRASSLALAISKEIIAHHGGSIWIDESSDLGGARICFTVPIGHLRMITETFDVREGNSGS